MKNGLPFLDRVDYLTETAPMAIAGKIVLVKGTVVFNGAG
jgi:hypothetical protein